MAGVPVETIPARDARPARDSRTHAQEVDQHVAARLRERRLALGLTMQQVADRDEDDAGLLERLATTRKLLQRAVAEGDVEAGIAAAACAELAGEYAAVFAAERGLPPGPVLDEVARVMRRCGAAVHHKLAPDSPVGSGGDLSPADEG